LSYPTVIHFNTYCSSKIKNRSTSDVKSIRHWLDTIPDKTTKRDLCFSASLMLTYPIVVNINR
jgi:hypothetical protein